MQGKFNRGNILIMPAAVGTGVIAGDHARAVLELAGIKDIKAKSYGCLLYTSDIIRGPVLTEKSYDQIPLKKYSFEVAIDANKVEIKKAVEEDVYKRQVQTWWNTEAYCYAGSYL